MTANDKQIAGTHYKDLKPEPWDVVSSWGLGYLDGTALKYIARWRHKNGVEDLKKAIHFLQKLIEEEEKKETSNAHTEHLTSRPVTSVWDYADSFGVASTPKVVELSELGYSVEYVWTTPTIHSSDGRYGDEPF